MIENLEIFGKSTNIRFMIFGADKMHSSGLNDRSIIDNILNGNFGEL